ncbi:hypothetical protein GOV05_05410 [Candidatus Woesearchaeota archaeon]|nr:hypothetical protein [Candidatus Woesearchaeota archaeon]
MEIICDKCKEKIKKKDDLLLFSNVNPFKFFDLISLHKKCYEQSKETKDSHWPRFIKDIKDSYYLKFITYRGWKTQSMDRYAINSQTFDDLIMLFILLNAVVYTATKTKAFIYILIFGLLIFGLLKYTAQTKYLNKLKT